jgi:hypothetical protein
VTVTAAVTAATVPAVESGRSLRRQLERVLTENRALRTQVAALELRCSTLVTDPRTASLPEPLVTEAAALLVRLRAEMGAVGVDDDAVRSTIGDFDLYVLRLVAAAWQQVGRLPADPPAVTSGLRRLEAVASA